MRNNIIRNMFLSFFTMGIFACSNELPALQDNNGESGDTHKVVLSINGISGKTAQTRALTEEETAALKAKEDAIDPDRIYAVVFDSEGAHGKTYKLTKGADDRYDFNIDTQGSYKLYMVANTNTVNQENAEYANADALYAVKELNRSADETTQFVMTSDVVNVTVDGTAAITNQDVTLKRAVARIDVESFEGFTIQSIDIENRYLGTKIARSGDDYDMSGLTMDNDEVENTDPTYHKKTYSFSNVLEVIGKIYTYENVSQTADEQVKLTVHGTTIDGPRDLPVTIAAVQRNHAYKVTITNTGATYDQLSYSIDVADWTAGTTLKWKDSQLTDNVTPDFYVANDAVANTNVSWMVGGVVGASQTKNPAKIVLTTDDTNPQPIDLYVVGGRVGSTITCTNAVTGANVSTYVSEVTADRGSEDGKIKQHFTITIPAANVGVYNCKIYNQVAGDVSYQPLTIAVRPDYSTIAVGDIIYADGRFSTTYDATIAADGNNPVAIVFHKADDFTTPTNMGTGDASKADNGLGYFRGYAMALKRYQTDLHSSATLRNRVANWCANVSDLQSTAVTDVQYDSSDSETQWSNITTDLSGLKHCLTAYDYCTTNSIAKSNMTAIYAATNGFESQVHAPAGTSGWYLPSIGQQYQWLKVFAASWGTANNVDLADRTKWSWRNGEQQHDYYMAKEKDSGTDASGNIATAINNYASGKLGVVYATFWEEFAHEHYLWSSTERTGSYPFTLYFSTDGSLRLAGGGDKSDAYRQVRAVLAF